METEIILNSTNTEQIITIEYIEPENELTKTPELEPKTFSSHIMKLESIIFGKIESGKTQPDYSYQTEILQAESDNEQEIESDNEQEVEFNSEESHSDLVLHHEVIQVESENDQKPVLENNQEIVFKLETQITNDTVIKSNEQEEIDIEMQEEIDVDIQEEVEVVIKEKIDVDIQEEVEVDIQEEIDVDIEEVVIKKLDEVSNTVPNDAEIITNIEVNPVVEDSLDQKDTQSSSTKTSSSTRRKRLKIDFDSEEGTSTEEVSCVHSDHNFSIQETRVTNERRPAVVGSPPQQQEGFVTRMRKFFCCCRPDVEINNDC